MERTGTIAETAVLYAAFCGALCGCVWMGLVVCRTMDLLGRGEARSSLEAFDRAVRTPPF